MVTKADFLKQLFSDNSNYSSDIDYAAAETGGGFFNLPEIMEDNSARKNPIVETVAKAAKAKKARRQVSVAQDFNPTAGNEVISLDDVAAGLNKMVTGGSPMDRINYPDDPYADDFMRDKPSPVDLRAVSSTPQAYNEEDKLNTFLSRVAGQTAQSVSGLYRMGLETTGLGNVMPNALGMLEELSKRAEKVQDTRTGYDTKTGAAIGEDAMNVGSSIAQMLLTGLSPYPLTAMGAMTAGQSYDANRNLGVSPGAAALAAGASGLAEGGFERVFGIGEGIQALKGALRSAGQTGLRNAATGAGRGLLNIAAGEEPSELMTTGIQGLVDRAVNPFHETSGMNQEMADTARVTAEQAGLLGLLGGGMSMAGRMSARRHQKQVDNQVAQARALQALDPNANPLAEFTAAMKSAREATEQAKQEAQTKPQAKPSDLLNGLLNRSKEQPATQPLRQTAPNVPNVPNVPTDVPVETVNQKTPIGAIIANGGINRDVLKKDLGWTDEELARLPQGVVSEKGTGILAARRALKQNGFDTDINAVLDTATRTEMPEENYSSAEYVQSPVVKTASRKSDASPLESGRTWEQERDAEMERDNQYYERLNGLSEKQLRGRLKALKKSKSSEAAEEIGLIHEILSGRPPVEKKEIPDALTRPPINRESFGFNRTQPEKQGSENAKNDASFPEVSEQKQPVDEKTKAPLEFSGDAERLTGDAPGQRSFQPTKEGQLDAATSNISENATPGNRIDQRKYFTAKDGSFVGVVDTGSAKPVMTVLGKNGETKEIPVGKQVRQMVSDGRLVSISKEDFEARKEGMKAKPVPEDETKPDENTGTEKQPGTAHYRNGREKPELNEKAAQILEEAKDETAHDVEPAKFSRSGKDESGDGSGKGMSVADLRVIANELASTFHNAPGIVIADRPQDAIPNALQDGMGLFDPNSGKVFLFARNIRDADTARAVFAHEVIAHYGLRGFFGSGLGDVLVSIRNHNPKIERMAQEWWRENQDYIKQVRENEGKNWTKEYFEDWQRDIAIEEALAELAENGEKVTGIKRFIAWIQQALRKLGWKWSRDLANWLESKTDAEALSALHQAGLFVRGDISGRSTTTKSDIEKFSRIGYEKDEPAAFSRKKEDQTDTVAKARGAFTVPDITLGDVIVRTVQDDNYDLKRVQDAIREQGGVITDRNDAYLSEERYLGKTKARLDKFTEGRVSPILETIRDSGVSLDEASQYVLARHVIMDKVNEKLKAINPDRNDNEALSGMSDADARAIMKEHGSNPKLKELGEAMDKLASFTRATMVSSGLITDETFKQWESAYQHYVPLHRDLDGTRKLSSWKKLKEAGYKPWDIKMDGQGQPDSGKKSKGFEVRGEESKRRMGSNLDVSNVIVNAIAQAEGAIIRAEKAKVSLALLDLAKANPNPDFWTVDTPVLKKQINPETGLVEYVYRDPKMKPADNILVVKEAGRERWITFNEENKRAMEIAKKFRNLDAAAMNWVVDSIGDTTRWMAGWLTQKNPIFMFFNFQRDIQHAIFNLADTPIAGKEIQFLKNVPLAMKGYWEITRSADKESIDNNFANYAREFKEAGAETGFIKSFESINDRIIDVEKELKKMSRGNGDPRTWMAIAGRAVDDYNAIIENGVRLAAYVTARENGMSIPRAASLAKNVTVNFNKRGTGGRWLNALYMFANANIQGNARMLKAVAKSRRARIYAGMMVGIGFAMDMMCAAILGDDDETGKKIWDEISEFDKERNWIIPISTTNYIKIPLPQGLHILPNIGRMLSELIRSGGKKNILESAARIALMTTDTLSPLGSAGSWLQMAFPSVLRPLVQLTENKSFTGSKLYRDDAPFGGYNAPAYEKAFKNTPDHWVSASKMLNYATGGDDVAPGKINVPPEAMRLLLTSFVAPGVSSQLFDKGFDALSKAGQGKDLNLRDLPIVSRMVGEMPDERAQERAAYDRMNDWRQNVLQINEYEKQERWNEADDAARRLGDGNLDLGNKRYDDWDAFNSDLRSINKDMKQAERDKDKVWQNELSQERKRLFSEFGRVD